MNGIVVTLTLSGCTYEQSIRDAAKVSGIGGVEIPWRGLERKSDTELTVTLEFDGNMNADATLVFSVDADAIAGYSGLALTTQVPVTASTESIAASTPSPLTEATLNGSTITLTLKGRTYAQSIWDVQRAVKVSGVSGATVDKFNRVSDTEVTTKLEFDGNIDTDATLTFSVGAGAVEGYNGPSLTAQLPVTASTESVVASTLSPLTEPTLNGSIVTLTLSGRNYVSSSWDISRALTITGIDGVTKDSVRRISNPTATVELEFNGDFDADGTLTFTVGADGIAGYSGPALTAQLPVAGGPESIVASTVAPLTEATLHKSVVTLTLSGRNYTRSSSDISRALTLTGINGVTKDSVRRVSDTEATVELEFNGDFDADGTLTFTVGPGAIADYNGPALSQGLPVSGIPESIVASTAAPLTEATLDKAVITLTLSGRNFVSSSWDISRALTIAGIDGVTKDTVRRISNTKATVELEFDGDMEADGTLTFTVGAGAIANYNGPVLTAQLPVTASQEFALAPNFPNPFNPETWIPYQLASDADVTLMIHASDGKLVRRLALGHKVAGTYYGRSRAAYWDGRNERGESVASGVYFYTLTAGKFAATRQMLIRK